MELLSSCYWQQGENDATLLLQQCVCEGKAVLFACVCGGSRIEGKAGGYLSRQLLEWFRGIRLKRAVKKPGLFLRKEAVRLEGVIHRADREAAEVSLTGILCLGQDCLIFGRGNAKILLLNRCLGRACSEILPGGEQLYLRQGVMETDIGILLATDSFVSSIPEKVIREGLFVEEVLTERQTERHLYELGKAGERAGAENMAAVLFYVKE